MSREQMSPDNDIELLLKHAVSAALKELYSLEAEPAGIKLELTNKDFEGDYTLVVFPYLKASRKKPEDTAAEIGNYLHKELEWVSSHNVVKGFLNLVISDRFWINFIRNVHDQPRFGKTETGKGRKVMVEYSSPNTNKPLHLGHIRNNLLGYSVAELLKFNSYEVIRCNLVNDRGIHICKSMLAWKRSGRNETPQSTGMKGDHLVGKYYVEFDKAYKAEINALKAAGKSEEEAEKEAPVMKEAQEMLRKWEAGDPEVISLWKMMNGWVYEGFDITYKRLGVDFDKYYYESDTYILGKEIVEEGLSKGVFYKKDDGSVWVDLTDNGLDQKLLLRADGTSVYMTQDLGTADLKYQEYGMEKSVYVVGNEQEYHFKVLQLILKKLGKAYAPGVYHLSYGMVELPEGKMKSREGTVVDADDLMDEMHDTAKQITLELGKTEGLDESGIEALAEQIGQGALKYFMLKVDPSKKMLFNPKESIDFQGNTGPFIQYTHARICSLLRNAGQGKKETPMPAHIHAAEKELAVWLYTFPSIVQEAADNYSPAVICNYVYELARLYNRFYYDLPVLKESDEAARYFRIGLSETTRHAIHNCLHLLGIHAPEKM